jgi:hypothetical protein
MDTFSRTLVWCNSAPATMGPASDGESFVVGDAFELSVSLQPPSALQTGSLVCTIESHGQGAIPTPAFEQFGVLAWCRFLSWSID